MTATMQVVLFTSFEQRRKLERAERMLAALASNYRQLRQWITAFSRQAIDVMASDANRGAAPWSVRTIVGPKYRYWC